ncbi:MAG: glycosyltransferase [Patescibacteria group bacterium]|jgi:glycosyltransferase involved in cell wall biosynthesis|nr:glycosyltransferase [Patescibacteria group bacterium]
MKKIVTIFTGLVSVDKNLVGTAVVYKKIADIYKSLNYQVNMVIPEETDLEDDSINFYLYDTKNNKKLINSSTVTIFGAYPPTEPLLYAYSKDKIIVTYLWSIAPIGSLEFKDFKSASKQKNLHKYISSSYNLSLLVSDKIYCRDEGVRKIVLGSLISLFRASLKNYLEDKQFANLLEVAPFGIENKKIKKSNKENLYRGQYKNITDNDFILLWNGGIWNWNDGETLIEAMKILKKDNIKLVFQGFIHPGKGKSLSYEARKTFNLAKKYNLVNKSVFFIDKWVPYQERNRYLLESNAGIITSPDITEANFFFKTRIYDYFYAKLPTILFDCEAFADTVKDRGLGLVARTSDANDLALKIKKLAKSNKLQKEIEKNIKNYQKEIYWDNTLLPVYNFAKHPRKLKKEKENEKVVYNLIEINRKIKI